MAKVNLTKDEWYPVYYPYGIGDYEVPDDLLKRWEETSKAFDEVQDELAKIYRLSQEQFASSDVTVK